LFFYGLNLTSASVASILINAEFLFSILFAISILKQRPGKSAYSGIAFIFIGLILLNAKADNSDIFQNNRFIGNMLIIAAAMFWALDNNISNVILKKRNTNNQTNADKIFNWRSYNIGNSFCIKYRLFSQSTPNSKSASSQLRGLCWFPFSFSKMNEGGWNCKGGNDFFHIICIRHHIRFNIFKRTHRNLETTILSGVDYGGNILNNQKQP
jgi:hypothetical protein